MLQYRKRRVEGGECGTCQGGVKRVAVGKKGVTLKVMQMREFFYSFIWSSFLEIKIEDKRVKVASSVHTRCDIFIIDNDGCGV